MRCVHGKCNLRRQGADAIRRDFRQYCAAQQTLRLRTPYPAESAMSRLSVLSMVLVLSLTGAASAATSIAPGIDLVPGRFIPNHQPDGNSILFSAPDGLIVMDTGRHAEHTQQILDYAKQTGQPIRAVINSHWHLDHIGGNPRIRGAYPKVRIYASDALVEARKGFLADYRKQLDDAIVKSADDRQLQQSFRDEIAIIDTGAALAPDEVITQTRTLRIAGRKLELHLEKNSVTAGDVWVFDPAARVLAAGDLVTLPVPFLDTACPARWKSVLDDLAKADFKLLVPGHGAPIQRREFEAYRAAYGNLLACAASAKAKSECIDGWLSDVGTLIAEKDRLFAKSLLDYYVDSSLRADPAKTAKFCGA
jgi:glyoxylase-like metal-dependent hydrolase (beta-lactamase superfamily II)